MNFFFFLGNIFALSVADLQFIFFSSYFNVTLEKAGMGEKILIYEVKKMSSFRSGAPILQKTSLCHHQVEIVV